MWDVMVDGDVYFSGLAETQAQYWVSVLRSKYGSTVPVMSAQRATLSFRTN